MRAFASRGAAVISSDEIVHSLLRDDGKVKAAIVKRLGRGVLDERGEIDRARVAEIVFGDRDALDWLEGLLHPRVVASYLDWRERLAELPDAPEVCVTEVPLLYEVGAEERFDVVVAVTASPAVRASRVVKPMADRERRLLPDSEKLARADFSYVNDGSLEELDAFVSDVMAKLRECSDR
ncbi:MAG: dephospho-CoA kinase [Actinomycetota bacterium]|nr:dephospho-CoA kinase [Actinomycetota bacterium]